MEKNQRNFTKTKERLNRHGDGQERFFLSPHECGKRYPPVAVDLRPTPVQVKGTDAERVLRAN